MTTHPNGSAPPSTGAPTTHPSTATPASAPRSAPPGEPSAPPGEVSEVSGVPGEVPPGGTTGVAGPLSYAVAESTARATAERLDRDPHRVWEQTSGGRPVPVPKRLLVAVSHAIERAVVSSPITGDPPTIVIALFQRLEFFERERVVYERLAEAGAEVVVGFVRGEEHEPPRGVHTLLLEPGERLADEWTVVAVGPRAGAFLVATDQHAYDAREHGVEAGRRFSGRWGYAHSQAGAELARLRAALGDRLDPGLHRRIDLLLADVMAAGEDVAGSGGTPAESWATASLAHMISRMQTAQAGSRALREQLEDAHRAADAHRSAESESTSGLPTVDFLRRWSAPGGSTELPVGLVLVDVAALGQGFADDRAAYHAAHQVAAALTQPLGPVDAAVRLSEREFLLVVPGASARHLAGLGDEVAEQLELSSDGYPNVPLSATLATIVTHARPLPIEDLRAALARLPRDADPTTGAVDAGTTVAGEAITVVSSRAGRVLAPEPADPEPSAGPRRRHLSAPAAVPPPPAEDGWFSPEDANGHRAHHPGTPDAEVPRPRH